MALNETARRMIDDAVNAIHQRTFFAHYPEYPKAYGEEAPAKGQAAFNDILNKQFDELLQDNPQGTAGEESSPYTQESLDIKYPVFNTETLISNSQKAFEEWKKTSIDERTNVLVNGLERIKGRFYEIAYATMHTTGQSFVMSFQASGPHSNDRALEALAQGYEELTRFPQRVLWEKPMGKMNVKLEKSYKPVPRGIGLVIGCSTFPVWNSVPGIFASLVTGNTVIVKPHPRSVLPIAIVVAELQKALKEAGYNPHVVQLAVDSSDKLITKELAENDAVKLIDFTGSSEFGEYIESLTAKGKTVFTEKAGVNSVIIDSVSDLPATMQNLSFAVSLYSGQMCTAPQNFFIPESGIKAGGQQVSYDEAVNAFRDAVDGLARNPKMGPGTLGAVQNQNTVERVNSVKGLGRTLLESGSVPNEEFSKARVITPTIIEIDAAEKDKYSKELFGPIILIIKTKDTNESIKLAKEMALKKGAITCAAYTVDSKTAEKIESEMESAFVPVSFNLTGPIWVNQHAAFSDFHVTGGNPAGNASFSDPDYVNKRYRWVGHRRAVA